MTAFLLALTVTIAFSLSSRPVDADDPFVPTDGGAGLALHTLSDDQKARIEKLGNLSIADQIAEIKKEVPIELIETGRQGGTHYFDALGPATRKLDQITDVEGLYGKAVCAKPDAPKPHLLIADDAPPTTLLHEYIHYLQMVDDKRWCELDGRILESSEKKERAILYHRYEFEVLKTLWDLREKFAMNFEDKLILVEGLNRENQVFAQMGVKGLEDGEAKTLEAGLEELHAQIETVSWMSKKREDADSVLQKIEVISLKSCAEQTIAGSDLEKINHCLAKRCEIGKLKCPAMTKTDLSAAGADDMLGRVSVAWLKPREKDDCSIEKFKDEMGERIETPTACWKAWTTEHAKAGKVMKMKSIAVAEKLKELKAPKLAIDNKIAFYEPPNPETFINTAYCYFIFEKVARFESLPIDQFPYAALGASFSLSRRGEFKTWLKDDPVGRSCKSIVKVFSGEEPSDLHDVGGGKKNILIINPVAALTGGMEEYKKALATDLNHERLHIIFSEDRKIQSKIKAEWTSLTDAEKEKFKKEHTSYDFSDENVLLKEYFSYSRQSHPEKLF